MILNSYVTGKKTKSDYPIIILHGLYGNSESWLRVSKGLEDNYQIHLLDLRNHGKSFHNNEHNYDVMTNDIVNYLKYHNLSKVFLVGHSMGGKAAMFFARKHPEMLSKLIIADISPVDYTSLTDYNPQTNFHLNLISYFKQLNPKKHSTYRDFGNNINAPNEAIKNLVLKNVKKESGKLKWRLNLDAIYNNLDNILVGFSPDDFIDDKINVKTLFVKGENSDYIKSNDLKLIDFIFSDASIVSIKNAGHWLHIEQPEKVSKAISNFLEKH